MNENSLKNLQPFTPERGKEMQLKSAKKKSQNAKERKVIREVIEKRLKGKDLDLIIDNLIERAKENSKDFETLQAAMGQKPAEKCEQISKVVDLSAFTTKEIKEMLDNEI